MADNGYDARVEVLIQRLDRELPMPGLAHPGDAAVDLYARQAVQLDCGHRYLMPTGVALALPAGFHALVLPRSGWAARSGVGLVNSPGLIDAGFRGEISVVLINLDPAHSVQIERGDRVAQLLVQRNVEVAFHEVESLPGSARGAGGFGSSGR